MNELSGFRVYRTSDHLAIQCLACEWRRALGRSVLLADLYIAAMTHGRHGDDNRALAAAERVPLVGEVL